MYKYHAVYYYTSHVSKELSRIRYISDLDFWIFPINQIAENHMNSDESYFVVTTTYCKEHPPEELIIS